jgi:segregation and condensation protein B
VEETKIKQIVEAALLASDGPLTVANLVKLFAPGELGEDTANKVLREALTSVEADASDRGVELKRVASGYRFQVRQELAEWVSRLWDEKPPRYTRALLETLALVAYKQPVTRGDIEQVRGVGVSQSIMRTLLEREWIKVIGHKEVPGKPALYATTKEFLDYFNLKSLSELPPLPEIRALIEPVLQAEQGDNIEATPVAEVAEADDVVAVEADAQSNVSLDASEGITLEPVSVGADVVPLHPESFPKTP